MRKVVEFNKYPLSSSQRDSKFLGGSGQVERRKKVESLGLK